MSTQQFTYEDDFESDEFKAKNAISFVLRKSTFNIVRLTMEELQNISAEGTTEFVLEDWFKRRLSASDFKRFWKIVNDKENPVHIKTVTKIIKDMETELQGLGNDEQTPKD